MLLIGLTGGIASGKTAVSDRFGTLGVPVVDADLLAREVVAPGSEGLAAVVATFGARVLGDSGALDRAALRTRVFADETARRTLDELLHPRIRELSESRLDALRVSGVPYAVYVVPLLVETEQQARFDRILVIDVPRELQRARLLARDGRSAAEADAILDAQASRDARLAVADDVIDNSGSPEATHAAVDVLHERYLALAAASRQQGADGDREP